MAAPSNGASECIGKRARTAQISACATLVGVLLRDRIGEKQLQDIMRFKMIESLREKSMLHAFSVVFVHSSSALGAGQPRDASAQPPAVLPLSFLSLYTGDVAAVMMCINSVSHIIDKFNTFFIFIYYKPHGERPPG